jgi:hypothetical protein
VLNKTSLSSSIFSLYHRIHVQGFPFISQHNDWTEAYFSVVLFVVMRESVARRHGGGGYMVCSMNIIFKFEQMS